MELSAFISRIPDLLWRASWQASVLVLLVLAAQWFCGRRLAPKWRYALWLLVVARLLLPVTPPSPCSLFNYGAVENFSTPGLARWMREETQELSSQDSTRVPAISQPPASSAEATSRQVAPTTVNQRSKPAPPSTIRSTFLFLRRNIVWIWFLGVLALSMRLAWGNYLFGLQLRRRRPIEESTVLALFEECRQTMDVRRPVTLLEAPELDSPALFGCFGLKLLLPEKMIGTFSASELRHVFLHELAHIRRWDAAVNWLTTILQTLHWFNPVLWFAFNRMRADREVACDELALARANEAESKPYGETVIKVLEGFTGPTAIPGLVGILEDKTQIKRRIHMIAQFNKTSPWPVVAMAVLVALGLVSLTDAQSKRGAEGLSGKAVSEKENQPDSKDREISKPPVAGSESSAKAGPIKAEKASTGLAIRALKVPVDVLWATDPCVSPDGRYIADGGRNLVEIATGETRKISDAFLMYPKFSPDGKQLLAVKRDKPWTGADGPNPDEIVIFDIATQESRRIYPKEAGAYWYPEEWSPDGREVLFVVMKNGWTRFDIVIVSVDSGSARVIKTLAKWNFVAGRLRFSSDSQWIVYDVSQTSADGGPRDIFLMATDGSKEVPVVQHPADDYLLGCSPSGNRILFGSNRRGGWDAYTIQTVDGKPVGEPELVKEGFGRPWSFGFTRNGAFLYRLSISASDVYLAKIDPVSGKVQTAPTKLPHRYDGFSAEPEWSPDGRLLAFVSTRGQARGGVPFIREMATGVERPLETSAGAMFGLHWSPDGRAFIAGDSGMSRVGLLRINANTGKASPFPTKRNVGNLVGWSADSRSFYFIAGSYGTVMRQELESGEETPIQLPFRTFPVIISPDGKHFGIADNFTRVFNQTNLSRIFVMPSEGGETRTIFSATKSEFVFKGLGWSHNSRHLFFGQGKRTQSEPWVEGFELWRVPVSGGEAEKLGAIPVCGELLRVSPDGSQIAFTVSSSKREVWVMENFLPKDNVVAK